MTWACANGHQVREGMFTCPACGSDDVRDRDGTAVATDQDTARDRRAAAMNAIQASIAMGAILYVIGVIACLDAVGGDFYFNGTVFVLGTVVSMLGAALALVGIVGYGVKLGNQAVQQAEVPELR